MARYAWAAISEWQCSQGVTQRGRLPAELTNAAKGSMRRARSVACMTQLQAKQQQDFHEEPDAPDRAPAERYGTFPNRPLSSFAAENLHQSATTCAYVRWGHAIVAISNSDMKHAHISCVLSTISKLQKSLQAFTVGNRTLVHEW